MAEDIFTSLSAKVEKLISMYESERAGSASLRQELESSRGQIAQYKEKQIQLEQKIKTLEDKLNSLQLAGAFTASPGDSAGAKRRLNAVIKEIDECISMLNM
jgi:DNA repair exonuclease SbcCD ATPase subunit